MNDKQKNVLFYGAIAFAVVIFAMAILFFMPDSSSPSVPMSKPQLSVSATAADDLDSSLVRTGDENLQIPIPNKGEESTIKPPNTSKGNSFNLKQKFDAIRNSIGSRDHKINAYLEIINNEQEDDSKIAALQALTALDPIEYTDEIIAITNGSQYSERVKASAVRTLSETYLLDQEVVDQVGGATIVTQTDKISSYIDSLVNDETTPEKVHDAALIGYAYTNYDNVTPMVFKIIQKGGGISDAEGDFISSATFVDNEKFNEVLPILQAHPESLTDNLIMGISTKASSDVVRENMSDAQRTAIVSLLRQHKLNPDHKYYELYKTTLNENINSIASNTPVLSKPPAQESDPIINGLINE